MAEEGAPPGAGQGRGVGSPPEPAAPLDGAWFSGLCRVAERPPRGMVAVRGDPADAALRAAVEAFAGPLPGRLRHTLSGGRGVVWMAPDEVLVMTPRRGPVPDLPGALVADMSDARAAIGLEGAGARDVLAKLVSVDLARGAFGPGVARRTRLGQVGALILCLERDAFEVLVARSVAAYALDVLRLAADPAAPVGLHR